MRVSHTESLSFFVLGSESPPIVLVFGGNHALMPVTIQVAWVENYLFQHVHFDRYSPKSNFITITSMLHIRAPVRCL